MAAAGWARTAAVGRRGP